MTNLENQGLKALLSGEQELKQERDTEEAQALNLVNEDLKQGIVFTEEEAAKVQRQREYAQQAVQAMEGVVVESKTRAQDLLKTIEASRVKVFDQLKAADTEFKNLQSQNRQLKLHKDKSDALHRQLEKEVEQLSKQEKQLREDWTRKVADTETQLKDRRDHIIRVIESLSQLNQELNQLKVQTQTT